MLVRLYISNYALIKELDIAFAHNFSVITGETGAGKSIILGALALILGQRADNLSMPDATAKCIIEGTFNIEGYDLISFFAEHDLDYDPSCIIRREITPQGKSRAFINDTPVNLIHLRDLTGKLVDIHSQHQTLLLQESAFQLSVLDAVAGNAALLQDYHQLHKTLRQQNVHLISLKDRFEAARAEFDYLTFLSEELQQANLKLSEQQELESEAEVLTHASEIKSGLFQVAALLQNDEENILRRINEGIAIMLSVARFHPGMAELLERFQACQIELQDLAHSFDRMAEQTRHDPERLEMVNDRLGLIYQLQQKHRVNSTEALIQKLQEIDGRLVTSSSLEDEIALLEKEIGLNEAKLTSIGKTLTSLRVKAIPLVEKEVLGTIRQLGMKEARFRVDIKSKDTFMRDGFDEVSFLFNANLGTPLSELSKVASGGELSRLMLAIKSLISTSNLLPTIIFDEIDIGISGDTAGKVGIILQKMSQQMQVIAITHLPQIAGMSNEHFRVYKFQDTGKTYSSIKKLNAAERIDEIAMMISGDADLKAARETAKALLQNI
jgi:DNA repair protein RecN (Recombination protein N)